MWKVTRVAKSGVGISPGEGLTPYRNFKKKEVFSRKFCVIDKIYMDDIMVQGESYNEIRSSLS